MKKMPRAIFAKASLLTCLILALVFNLNVLKVANAQSAGDGGTFSVTTATNGNIVNLATADAAFATGVTSVSNQTSINFRDRSGNTGHYSGDSLFPNMPSGNNNFAIKVEGSFLVPASGTYTFGTRADDGVRILIDGVVQLIDDSRHGEQDRLVVVNGLSAGVHNIEVVFFEHLGGAALELFWAAGSFSSWSASDFSLLSAVPQITDFSVMTATAGNITNLAAADQAFANGAVSVSNHSSINFRDVAGNTGHYPGDVLFPNMPAGNNNFAIKVQGLFLVPESGSYTFGTRADDGIRLSIDGIVQLVDDSRHAELDKLVVVNGLSAGVHSIELVFFEYFGGAALELFWAAGSHNVWNAADFSLLSATDPNLNPPEDNQITWVSCAVEGSVCSIPSGEVASVRFGANDTYKFAFDVSNSINCNNPTFGGDPVPNVRKACEYSLNLGGPLKVFIIAGQSNAVGDGMIGRQPLNSNDRLRNIDNVLILPSEANGTLRDLVFNDPERSKYKFLLADPSQNSIAPDDEVDWAQRDDVRFANIGRFHAGGTRATEQGPLKVLYGDRKVIGAELGFGHAMGAYLPNQMLILKYGVGGGSLYTEYMPPSRRSEIGQIEIDRRNNINDGNANNDRTGECVAGVSVGRVRVGGCYDSMITSIKEVLATEESIKQLVPDYLGQGFEFGGLVWIHGMSERDGPATSNPYTPGPKASEYAENLSAFMKDFTGDLSGMSEHIADISDMPTVMLTPGLSCCSSFGYDYSQIEIAQLEAPGNTDMFSENAARTANRSVRVGPIYPVDTRLGYEGLVFENDPLFAPTFSINSSTPSIVKAWKSWHWFHSAKTYLDFGLSAAHALINAQDPSISLFSVGGSVAEGADTMPPTISFNGIGSDEISILASQGLPNVQAACVDNIDPSPTLIEALPVYREVWDKTVPSARIKPLSINEIGRKYIVRYQCSDSSGNSSVRGLRVNVVAP